MIDIKNNIKGIIAQKKLSGAEVARRIGMIPQGFYQMIERENIEIDSLKKIARALDVSVSELVKDNDENIKIDNLPAYGNPKVVIEIEIDQKIEGNKLKMVFGKDFFNRLMK